MTAKRNDKQLRHCIKQKQSQLQAAHIKFIRDALKNFGINQKNKARCRYTVVADENAPNIYYIGKQFTIKKECQRVGYSKWALHVREDSNHKFRLFHQCVKEMIMRVIDNDFDNFADNFQAN